MRWLRRTTSYSMRARQTVMRCAPNILSVISESSNDLLKACPHTILPIRTERKLYPTASLKRWLRMNFVPAWRHFPPHRSHMFRICALMKLRRV
jgi:hypothetical protein